MYPEIFKNLWLKEAMKDVDGNVIGSGLKEKEFKIRYHCNIVTSMSE